MTARLLGPAARIWAGVSERRLARATPYRSRLPVVCVGNFTAGGTGKTPFATRVVAELCRLGRTPVVLSRGHGGRRTGPHLVDPAADTARDVGDEPLLHAAHVPVVVARDRAAGARLIEARGVPTDVVVMDDGLQNPTLAKDLAIAVVDGRRGLGNGLVMPAGPLRAPLAFQLARTDAVLVNVSGGADAAQNRVAAAMRAVFAGPVLTAMTVPAEPLDWLAGLAVVAWAGIANPVRFFDLLALHGARIAERAAFPDHHMLGDREARRLLAAAERHGARLVTTEKDRVRLNGGTPAQVALQLASRPLPIAVDLAGHDARRLEDLLTAMLARHGEAPAGAGAVIGGNASGPGSA